MTNWLEVFNSAVVIGCTLFQVVMTMMAIKSRSEAWARLQDLSDLNTKILKLNGEVIEHNKTLREEISSLRNKTVEH